MVLAAIPRVLQDVGAGAAALTATLLFVGLVWRSRPMRWVWRRLIADPFAGWLHSVAKRAATEAVAEETSQLKQDVAEVKAEVTYNHGTSLKDAVRRIEQTVAQFIEHK